MLNNWHTIPILKVGHPGFQMGHLRGHLKYPKKVDKLTFSLFLKNPRNPYGHEAETKKSNLNE